jgi:hypothetical protein
MCPLSDQQGRQLEGNSRAVLVHSVLMPDSSMSGHHLSISAFCEAPGKRRMNFG